MASVGAEGAAPAPLPSAEDADTARRRRRLDAVDSARKRLRGLSLSAVAELTTFTAPPDGALPVLQAVVSLLGRGEMEWPMVKGLLMRGVLVEEMDALDVDAVSGETVARTVAICKANERAFHDSGKVSAALGPMSKWVLAVLGYTSLVHGCEWKHRRKSTSPKPRLSVTPQEGSTPPPAPAEPRRGERDVEHSLGQEVEEAESALAAAREGLRTLSSTQIREILGFNRSHEPVRDVLYCVSKFACRPHTDMNAALVRAMGMGTSMRKMINYDPRGMGSTRRGIVLSAMKHNPDSFRQDVLLRSCPGAASLGEWVVCCVRYSEAWERTESLRKDLVHSKEKEIRESRSRVESLMRAFHEHLCHVIPPLDAAKEALSKARSETTPVHDSLPAPPPEAQDVIYCVVTLLGHEDMSWPAIRRLLLRGGVTTDIILDYDLRRVTPEMRCKVRKRMEEKPTSFDQAALMNKRYMPRHVAALLEWVVAALAFCDVLERIEPMESELSRLTNDLERVQAQLDAAVSRFFPKRQVGYR